MQRFPTSGHDLRANFISGPVHNKDTLSIAARAVLGSINQPGLAAQTTIASGANAEVADYRLISGSLTVAPDAVFRARAEQLSSIFSVDGRLAGSKQSGDAPHCSNWMISVRP